MKQATLPIFPAPDIDLFCGDCLEVMKGIPDGSVDITVTSPPYDNLRTYNNSLVWNWEVFTGIAKQLFRVTKQGGVVVWVVGDATINGSETGTSFKQALHFKEIGFNLETMIYQKKNVGASGSMSYYLQSFEYMFVLSKGVPATKNIIRDRKNISAGIVRKTPRRNGQTSIGTIKIKEYGRRMNIWEFVNNKNKTNHPAPFPEQLACDHIISWSNEGDTVLDPMMGSGTTGKMAARLNRNFIGIEKDETYFKIAENRIN